MGICTSEPAPVPAELYEKEVCGLVKRMLWKEPEQRPSADEILALPFVRRCLEPPVAACRTFGRGRGCADTAPARLEARGANPPSGDSGFVDTVYARRLSKSEQSRSLPSLLAPQRRSSVGAYGSSADASKGCCASSPSARKHFTYPSRSPAMHCPTPSQANSALLGVQDKSGEATWRAKSRVHLCRPQARVALTHNGSSPAVASSCCKLPPIVSKEAVGSCCKVQTKQPSSHGRASRRCLSTGEITAGAPDRTMKNHCS